MPYQIIKRGFSIALLLGLLSTYGAASHGLPWSSSAILGFFGIAGLIITNILESENKK